MKRRRKRRPGQAAVAAPENREAPPPYFGDYPDGAYWSALRPDGHVESDEEDYSVEGPELRLMYDTGGGPLWDMGGLLPDEPEWLERALGLSDSLIADLLGWMRDHDVFYNAVGLSEAQWRAQQADIDRRGEDLVLRLQAEAGPEYRVRYRP